MLKINFVNQYDDSNPLYQKTIQTVMNACYRTLHLRKHKIINVILVTDAEIQRLNATYRLLDHPTDVISFENTDLGNEMGDIFIAVDIAKAQATQYGHTFERELGFLACHGFLHCNGYDHVDAAQEKMMFELQDLILTKIHLTR
jgi:probable rRNA maturation factor